MESATETTTYWMLRSEAIADMYEYYKVGTFVDRTLATRWDVKSHAQDLLRYLNGHGYSLRLVKVTSRLRRVKK